jgi:uridine kinase
MPEIDSIKPSSSFLLGVAGGSGSGKTYFAEALVRELKSLLGEDICEIVLQDNFYIDQSHRFDHDGGRVNFDHPDSIEFSLLAEHLKTLKAGNSTEIPTYDFATHKRKLETIKIEPKKIIIVDGILIFNSEPVRCLFDDLIFFQTPEDLRYERRLKRDVQERGRTPEGVKEQFLKQVKPMHDQFVEPSKQYAKTLVNDMGEFDQVLKFYVSKFSQL